jgi:hypothetical protein
MALFWSILLLGKLVPEERQPRLLLFFFSAAKSVPPASFVGARDTRACLSVEE